MCWGFVLSFFAMVKILEYVVHVSRTNSPSIMTAGTQYDAPKSSDLPSESQVTDRYAVHLLAANDPNAGCGCPDCYQML
jgi:hypothetical protein